MICVLRKLLLSKASETSYLNIKDLNINYKLSTVVL